MRVEVQPGLHTSFVKTALTSSPLTLFMFSCAEQILICLTFPTSRTLCAPRQILGLSSPMTNSGADGTTHGPDTTFSNVYMLDQNGNCAMQTFRQAPAGMADDLQISQQAQLRIRGVGRSGKDIASDGLSDFVVQDESHASEDEPDVEVAANSEPAVFSRPAEDLAAIHTWLENELSSTIAVTPSRQILDDRPEALVQSGLLSHSTNAAINVLCGSPKDWSSLTSHHIRTSHRAVAWLSGHGSFDSNPHRSGEACAADRNVRCTCHTSGFNRLRRHNNLRQVFRALLYRLQAFCPNCPLQEQRQAPKATLKVSWPELNSPITSLGRYAEFTKPVPRISRSVRTVLAHWTVGTDPNKYNVTTADAQISGLASIAGSQMSIETRQREERRKRRQREREEQRARVKRLRAEAEAVESQPIAAAVEWQSSQLQAEKAISEAAASSSQPQVAAASQVERGRFGGSRSYETPTQHDPRDNFRRGYSNLSPARKDELARQATQNGSDIEEEEDDSDRSSVELQEIATAQQGSQRPNAQRTQTGD
ncbi:hypothetical protein MRB53_037352 [Persea americana]|nr:hypothetical protein MRB53_037352 [Persea americana]